jgi:hypothetical protein
VLLGQEWEHGWLAEVAADGRLVWEAVTAGWPCRTQVVYPLVRLGFPRPAGAAADFHTVRRRLEQLACQSLPSRRQGALRLEELKPSAAELRVVVRRLSDPDPIVRRHLLAVAKASRGRLGPDAIGPLLGLLGKPATVTYEVADLLRGLGPEALPPLVALAEDRSQPPARRAEAAYALARWLDDARAAAALRRAFRDKDRRVQERAVEGVCCRREAARGWVPEIARLLKGEDRKLARTAAQALGLLAAGGDVAIPALVEAAAVKDLRDEALWALAQIGTMHPPTLRKAPEVLPAMLKLLRVKGDPQGRLAATAVLYHLGPAAKSAVPALTAALNERPRSRGDDSALRRVTAEALGRIGPAAKGAVPALVAIVKDEREEEEVRRAAVHALGGIGPGAKSAAPALVALAGKETPFPVQEVFDALQVIDPASARQAVQASEARFPKVSMPRAAPPP